MECLNQALIGGRVTKKTQYLGGVVSVVKDHSASTFVCRQDCNVQIPL